MKGKTLLEALIEVDPDNCSIAIIKLFPERVTSFLKTHFAKTRMKEPLKSELSTQELRLPLERDSVH